MSQHTRAGREVVIEGSTRTLFDPQGTPLGYIGINRDVTERMRVEAELRAREERFQAMIETSADAMLLVDAAQQITYVSPNIRRLLGYDADQFRALDLLAQAHPHDQAALQAFREQMLATPDIVGQMTLRIRHQDGSWRWIERSVSNQLHNPAIQRLIVSLRDGLYISRLVSHELIPQALADSDVLHGTIIRMGPPICT